MIAPEVVVSSTVQLGEGPRGGFIGRVALLLGLLGACATLNAEPPAAQFAAGQLDMAEAALEQARAALETHDYAMVQRLAAQAGLDARLAWGMTDSHAVRSAAIEVNRQAERLRSRGVLSAGFPEARP